MLRRSLLRALALVVVVTLGAGVACSDDDESTASPTTTATAAGTSTLPAPPAEPLGVGVVTRTFVDSSRPTPPSGDQPAQPERTLETRIFYPAAAGEGSTEPDAEPAREAGPYPLVVFAHGLGASPDFYADLLAAWAGEGFVVAAPLFPLSGAGNAEVPDAGDVVNQPGDVSFLVTELTARSEGDDEILSGLLAPGLVAAGGHSNGAITTLGLVGHTCCRDDRIGAALVLAGTPSPFPDGEYDLAGAAPTLFVAGTDDALVAYEESVRAVEAMTAPRGLVTVIGGDHSSWVRAGNPAFPTVVDSTVAFLRSQLLDDEAAAAALPGLGEEGVTTVLVALEPGEPLTVPTTSLQETDRQATVTPSDGLVDGQVVSVSWSGFLPGRTVNIVQCASGGTEGASFCDLTLARILQPDPTGEGTLELEIIVGRVGEGECSPDSPPCVVVVNDAGLQDPEATVRIPITFAG